MWAWYSFDLRTGAQLATLPVEKWECTAQLNDAGSWSATLIPPADAASVRAVVDGTLRARSVVVGFRDGTFAGGGIVWRRKLPEVAGAGLLSYFDRRHLIDDPVTYTAADQHTMFADLVDRAEGVAAGNIGIDTSQVTTSGVTRDQTWTASEAKNVGEALRQKADIDGGPDFAIEHEIVGGVLVRRLRCWTPQRGRSWSSSQLSFIQGHNVLSAIDTDEDGIKLTTRVVALGEETSAGPPPVRRTATATDVDVVGAGWPILDARLDMNDIKTDAVLADHADGHLEQWAQPKAESSTFRIDPAMWGSFELGDECREVIPSWTTGTIPDPWLPDGRNELRRITATRWVVDGDGEQLWATTGPVTT